MFAHQTNHAGDARAKPIDIAQVEQNAGDRLITRFAVVHADDSWSSDLPVVSIGYLWNKLFDSLPGPLSDLGIDRVVDENWLPITHADAGLCGGMVYAVMDYYAHHMLPPNQATSPSCPSSRDDVMTFCSSTFVID